MENVQRLISRAWRYVVPRASKERYFSATKWDAQWSNGYDLNLAREDARYGALIALMRRHEGDGPILDAGCGDGLLAARYRKISDARIVAFDYSAAAIELARARELTGVEFFCADSRTYRPNELFSMIVLNESLYYIDDYQGVMRTLSGALLPGGLFIVSMHDASITRRIWKNIQRVHEPVDGVGIEHEPTGGRWRILALRPKA